MKLTKKELKISWLGFLFFTGILCVFLEELNRIKGRGNVKIYSLIIVILFLIFGNFLLYFLISKKTPNNIDTFILWVLFVLITSLTSVRDRKSVV